MTRSTVTWVNSATWESHNPEFSDTSCPPGSLVSMPYDCHVPAEERNATFGPLKIDYLYLHHCAFTDVPALSILILLLWLGVLFYMLGSTADGYFSPTLASISEKLRVPYEIAGVTFLAFGNGAPDVFSSIAAYSSDVGEAGINELLGGAMFVTTVVVGGVAIASKAQVQSWAYSRDVSALMLALVLLVLLAIFRSNSDDIEHHHRDGTQLLFFSMYLVYVSTAVIPECISRLRRKNRAKKYEVHHIGDEHMPQESVVTAFWHAVSPVPPSQASSCSDVDCLDLSQTSYELASSPGIKHVKMEEFSGDVIHDHFRASIDTLESARLSDDEDSDGDFSSDEQLKSEETKRTHVSSGARVIEGAYWRHLRWCWRTQRRIVQLYGGSANILLKVLSLPHFMLVFVRDVTVPLVDTDSWSRSLASISLITVPQFFLFSTGYTHVPVDSEGVSLWMLVLAASIIAAVVVFFTTHRSHPPDSFLYCALFILIAFIACVCWVYAVADELVAVLVALGAITKMSNSLLGATVLAWGNSIGDLVTNISIARAGYPKMAIAGCYGGPVFNILVGLGLPMIISFARGGALMLEMDMQAWISLGFLSSVTTMSYMVFWRNNFLCPAWYGKVLVAVYIAYTAVNITMAVLHKVESSES